LLSYEVSAYSIPIGDFDGAVLLGSAGFRFGVGSPIRITILDDDGAFDPADLLANSLLVGNDLQGSITDFTYQTITVDQNGTPASFEVGILERAAVADYLFVSVDAARKDFSNVRLPAAQTYAAGDTFDFEGTLDLSLIARKIIGTSASENLRGSGLSQVIEAGDGFDWITPGAGSDTIDGGTGRDMVSFADLVDTAGRPATQYRLELDLNTGIGTTSGNDVYTLQNVERITGTVNPDRIAGDAENNEIRGLGGFDWFMGSDGTDTYDGGTGEDMVSYLGADAAITLNLSDVSANTGQAAGDEYTSIERFTGTNFVDYFYGDDGENNFRGMAGYDVFFGSAGGRERYDGGSGSDTITYVNSTAGVIADLGLGYGSGGDASRDLYTSIENLGGTNFDDMLVGDDGRNNLRGLSGNDTISGGGGIDRIFGGRGEAAARAKAPTPSPILNTWFSKTQRSAFGVFEFRE